MGVGPRTSGRCPLTFVFVDGHSPVVDGHSSVVHGHSSLVQGLRPLSTDISAFSTGRSLQYVAESPLSAD
jgi:hypothetical protein